MMLRMRSAELKTKPARPAKEPLLLGPAHNGCRLTPREFDAADAERLLRYELLEGVLVVSPHPSMGQRAANDLLGSMLRNHRDNHPSGRLLDTVYHHTLKCGRNRLVADRVVWIGPGRPLTGEEPPSLVIEYVRKEKALLPADLAWKLEEYRRFGVRAHWLLDRFSERLQVHSLDVPRPRVRTVGGDQAYHSPLLPGFDLDLKKLFLEANSWDHWE